MVTEMDRPSNNLEHHQSDASAALLADIQDSSSFSQSSKARVDAAGESSSDSFSPAASTTNTPGANGTTSRDSSGASSANTADSSNPPGQNENASEWTVIIDLAATKIINGQESGSADKAEQLKQLVEESRDKPVDMFVQLVDKQDDGSNILRRYEIENGQLTSLDSKPAQDFASDLQDFISTATANSDSERLALIINNDGGGAKGMTGDDNAKGQITSPSEFVDAVRQGLQNSGHDRLDLLDMDACLTAEVGFLDSASQVANNFVGSAETERVRPGGVNAQNLNSAMERLFENPEMTGQQFGDSIVEEARNGSNQAQSLNGSNEHTRFDSGTNTLINLNLENYQEFDNAYNEFGNQLAEALSEPGNQTEIDNLIEQAPRFGLERSVVNSDSHSNRDLQTFAQDVQRSIDQGKLTDNDGSLSQSVENLLAAQNEITSSYYGQETDEGYDKMGGLSAFLPDSQYRDPQLTAQTMTGVGQFQDSVVHFLDRLRNHPENIDEQTVNGIVTSLKLESKSVTKNEDESNQTLLEPLRNALSNLDNVHSAEELTEAVSGIETITTELLNSELNARLTAEILPSVQDRHNDVFRYESAAGDSGWNRFINALGS